MKTIKNLILFILVCIASSTNAQTIVFYKNGTVIQEYCASEVDSIVYKPMVKVETVLIGSISLKGDVADPLDVQNNISSEDIERNIENGLLFEKEYTQVLSTVKSSEDKGDYTDYVFGTFNAQIAKCSNPYTYTVVLIPESLNGYIGAWGDSEIKTGTTFGRPQGTIPQLTGTSTISYNGKTYTVYGYYFQKRTAATEITIVKNN